MRIFVHKFVSLSKGEINAKREIWDSQACSALAKTNYSFNSNSKS